MGRPSASCPCPARQVTIGHDTVWRPLRPYIKTLFFTQIAPKYSRAITARCWLQDSFRLASACSIRDHAASRFVCAGIPVHINGYFELSSNRRNIWHSSLQSESSGAGKHKSDWNVALLEVRQVLLVMH